MQCVDHVKSLIKTNPCMKTLVRSKESSTLPDILRLEVHSQILRNYRSGYCFKMIYVFCVCVVRKEEWLVIDKAGINSC